VKNPAKSSQNISIRQIIGKFWDGARPMKGMFFTAYILFFVSNVVNVFIPLYYKKFFDVLGKEVANHLAALFLIKIIAVIFALHFLGWFLWRIGIYIYNKMQSTVMARLKQNAFDYMMHHSYTFFANSFTGSLVQKVGRFSRSFEALTDSFAFNIIPLIISITGSILVTYFVAPIISAIIIGWVVVFTTFNILYSRWKLKYDLASSEADSRTTGYLSDAITNNNAISLFTGFAYESAGFRDVSMNQAKKQRLSWQLGEVVDATQGFLIFIVEFFVFYYAIKYWELGLVTIGTFVLAQTYIIGLAQQLWGLNRIIRNMYQSIADSKEMVEILIKPYEIKDIQNAKDLNVSKGEIDFRNVSFSFREGEPVIYDLNIHIAPGEKVAVIGPSGAGKTTFVRLIMRLYDVTKGCVFIDGQNIGEVVQDSLRENISLVPQDPILFHRTLLENIRYGRRDATDEEVKTAARLAHCGEFIESLPLKYETFVGERGIKLSGGERQRVAIARAILKKAPILILDEATSSLDSYSESLIQDALDNLMRGATTIVIAHRLSTIKKMDRIITMSDGKIIEEGTHDELSNKESGLYKKLWNLQVSGFIADSGEEALKN